MREREKLIQQYIKDGKPICRYYKTACLEQACAHWVVISGRDPQTGETISQGMCAEAALVKATLENNLETRQAAAAIESFRNEVVKGNEQNLVLKAHAVARLLGNGRG